MIINDSSPWAALRAMADEFSPRVVEATRDLYVPGVLTPEAAGAGVTRDLAYGGDERHRLDVFRRVDSAGEARPVVVFVHGGGFVGGDKGAPGAPFYNNVGAWAVRSGFIGINVTYRLAPAHRWPAGAEDVAAAMEWTFDNVHLHGGDPQKVVVMGQSAGAAHVAGYLTASRGARSVAGAVLLSGIYEPDAFRPSALQDIYFGTDRALQSRQSTVLGLAALSTPCLFTISEFDPALFQHQLAAVIAARAAIAGRVPEVLWQGGHNHFSTSMQLGGAYDSLGPHLAAFVSRVTSGAITVQGAPQ